MIRTYLHKRLLAVALSLLVFHGITVAQQYTAQINAQLSAEREKYNLTSADISNYRVSDQYTDETTGFTYTYLQQQHQKIDVYNAISVCAIKDDKVAYFKPQMIDHLAEKIKTTQPSITPEAAIGYALIHLGRTDIPVVKLIETDKNTNTLTFESPSISASPVKVKLVYRAMDEGVFLAWDVSIEMKNEPHWWNIRIDALTGNYLDKNDWTANCSFDPDNHNCAIHDESASSFPFPLPLLPSPVPAEYTVFQFPVEAPSFGSRTLASNPSDNTASPHGWHDDNGVTGAEYTITRGNNVHSYEDANNDNLPGYSPNSATLQFNYTLDLTQAPTVNQDAALTNLFYACNRIHDVTYHAGFTEAAGNFQQNNYGRGGTGNDYVKAEGFDGSGTNNANFSTPVDGSSGRMQMYLWTAPTPDRDGSLDNGIIAHEYGHGISNRLTGGPGNSSCLGNAEQGGEGWSDWLALIMTTEASDTIGGGMLTQARGIGTYALNQATNGVGIRRYRYSVDMSINPQTYADLATSSGAHQKGEIWCDAIWDMTCFLINDYGYSSDPTNASAGNNIAMRLVLEGMKLQPCSPGYLDGRDAILAADANLYGNAHRCRIWEAFARRGMGVNAVQGSSNSSTDQTANFNMPAFCLVATQPPVAAFNSNVTTVGCAGTIQFTDASTQAFSWLWNFNDGTTSTSQNPSHQFNAPGNYNVKLIVTNPLGSDSITHIITVTPTYTANVTATPNPVACGAPVQLNAAASGSNNINYTVAATTYAPYSGTLTAVSLTDDVTSGVLPIGFNFSFYGQTYSSFYICSNGYITFTSGQPASPVYGVAIPNVSTPNNYIAGAWNDLNPSNAGSSVGYFVTGSAPNRKLVVQYITSHYGGTGYPYNFQIVLCEGSNNIEIHTTTISNASAYDANALTVQGVENSTGTKGTAVPGRNAAHFSATNDAYLFTPTVSYTYSWLPGNLNGASQTVNPTTNTTYTVNVADGSGCVTPFTSPLITVTPLTVTISGNTIVCPGNSTVLNAGSYASYLWTTGETTQTISVNTTGTYGVQVTSASGCTGTASVTVTSVASPVITGNLTPCNGSSTTLSTGVYSSYLWSTGSTGQSITVSTSATYTVTVTSNGCTASATAKVTKKAKPTVSLTPSSANICPNQLSATLNASGTGTSYNWSPGTGLNQTTGAIVIATPAVTTTYTVTASNVAGCTATKTSKLTVKPKPVNFNTTNITAVSAVANWDIVDCAVGYGFQYRIAGGTWITSNVNTNTGSKSLAGLSSSTNYQWRVRTKFSDGTFSAYTSAINFTTLALRMGADLSTSNELLLNPNPASEKLFISFQPVDGNVTIKVIDAIGQVVMEKSTTSIENNANIELNIVSIKPGLYMVQVINDNKILNGRFIKN